MDYQNEYIIKNPTLHCEDASNKAKYIKHILEKVSFKPNSIVDVGCGSGMVLMKLLENIGPVEACGIDISSKIIDIAIKNDQKKLVRWIKSDIFQLNIVKYDLVIAIDIIEHIQDDRKLLKKISDFGKFFIIKVPIEDNLVNKFIKFLTNNKVDPNRDTEKKYGHIHHYSEKSFTDMLVGSNYNIIKLEYMYLPKRSKLGWEIIRILLMPLWVVSKKLYVLLNGGFIIVFCKSSAIDL